MQHILGHLSWQVFWLAWFPVIKPKSVQINCSDEATAVEPKKTQNLVLNRFEALENNFDL